MGAIPPCHSCYWVFIGQATNSLAARGPRPFARLQVPLRRGCPVGVAVGVQSVLR